MHTLYELYIGSHNKHNHIINIIKLWFSPNNQYMRSFNLLTYFVNSKKYVAFVPKYVWCDFSIFGFNAPFSPLIFLGDCLEKLSFFEKWIIILGEVKYHKVI